MKDSSSQMKDMTDNHCELDESGMYTSLVVASTWKLSIGLLLTQPDVL